MKNVAITGVSGYIGGRLLSRLAKIESVKGIVGLDVKPPAEKPAKLKFYCRDILRPFGDIFVDNQVDTAVHLVFVMKPTHHHSHARRVDIGGMVSFLQACEQARVKHILYLSSHTVYGAYPRKVEPLTEGSPLRPLPGFQYSLHKAEAEHLLKDFAARHGDVRLAILRSCPVIGPNAADSVAAVMFQPVMLRLAGYDPLMQFVHEDDLIELMAILLHRQQGGIFNVAGEGEVRYSDVIALAGRKAITLPGWLLRPLMGLSWTLRLQKESPPSGLEFIKYPPLVSTEKLKREVGFQFRHSSREAVASFLSASVLSR
ncbi:MAG: NAD-dependent epimerase/dehydratase family protein [Chloroflexi bacterium]|nr:NAD-dependent epimerase/dehydratase family protein [Chloroflexota bacterium]